MFDDLPPSRSRRESVLRRTVVREYGRTVWALNWMEGVQEGSARSLVVFAARRV